MTQFNLELGEAARNEGMNRAEAGASEEWKSEAREIAVKIAKGQAELTSDDIWKAGLREPQEPRALGPVMSGLARDGMIRKSGRFIKTTRVSRHATDIAVWISLIKE